MSQKLVGWSGTASSERFSACQIFHAGSFLLSGHGPNLTNLFGLGQQIENLFIAVDFGSWWLEQRRNGASIECGRRQGLLLEYKEEECERGKRFHLDWITG